MKDRSAKYHQGITMHAMRVAGCVAGAVFTLGAMVIVLAGLPIARWFLLAAIAGGIAAFFLIRSAHSSS
ncbi:MAG: hypothetical protein ACRD2Y_07010 [Terriglobales bacterium]